MKNHTAPVHAVAIAPDSRHAASGGADRTVLVSDLKESRGAIRGAVLWDPSRSISAGEEGHRCLRGRWNHPIAGLLGILQKSQHGSAMLGFFVPATAAFCPPLCALP